VPGATAGIVGIRQAGLAISVGLWSSLNVISSFCWGLGVFHERVKSVQGALHAAFILILGLTGMAYYSVPLKEGHPMAQEENDEELKKPLVSSSLSIPDSSADKLDDMEQMDLTSSSIADHSSEIELASLDNLANSMSLISPPGLNTPGKMIRRKKSHITEEEEEQNADEQQPVKDNELIFFHGKIKMTKRQLGLLGAAINGIWGSNSLIPLHYARWVLLATNDCFHMYR
jgi:hypothetical protein